MHIGATPPTELQTEWSVASSCPSTFATSDESRKPNNFLPHRSKGTFEFVFEDGNMVVSSGMMTRLCQEGHIFKLLLFGGEGFREENCSLPIDKLKHYGITKQAFKALVFSLRTNNTRIAYKHRLSYESIGGFKTIDKYHRKRVEERKQKNSKPLRNIINFMSDEE